MRKIDKSKILSTEYKKWLDGLNRKEKPHPVSNNLYKNDVVMNLLHCQRGVCAYTEMFLCNPDLITEEKWENGRYKSKKVDKLGSLEHFDPRLKKENFWEWDNLFVISLDINVKKGANDVDYILKPDSPEYDPMMLFKYDTDFHVFSPHPRIKDKAVRERILCMIDILHLNYDPVRCKRRKFLTMVFELREFECPVEINCFFTACRMALLE